MEFRTLPRGGERFSTIGLGLGAIHTAAGPEIERALDYAISQGVNFFDVCGGGFAVYEAFGRSVAGRRERIYTQMHFGAVYDEQGQYGFSRDLERIKHSFATMLETTGMDYTDFGFVHCIDENADFDSVMTGGLFDYIVSLKDRGIVRHIGFSTHHPAIARRFLETGVADMFMFSVNPAYDYSTGEYGNGSPDERAELYREAARLGVGISVMKPFAGGLLLNAAQSPIGVALSRNQCIQYALDRPGVLTCLPGVGCEQDVKDVLEFYSAAESERGYSLLGKITPTDAAGRCVYCSHCAPCPRGVDIGLVNKYYDLAATGDALAASHYGKLSVKAGDCAQCGHCDRRCPFHVKQSLKMREILGYFGE